MGNEQAKPSDRLKHIDRDIKSLSSNFRGSRNGISKEEKARIVETLAKYSNEANALRGKVKDKFVDDIQRHITYAMNEVLSSEDDNLDQGAVETNSFVQMPLNKRLSLPRSTSDTPMKKTKSEIGLHRHAAPTIQDIEAKLKTLRPKIKQAIDDKDSTQLRLHQQTIKVLATDLEMIDVMEQTPIGDKKEKLISIVTNQYQKINKAMKDIRRSKDLSYLSKQDKKEKTLIDIEDIRKSLDGTNLIIMQALKKDDKKAIKSAEKSLQELNQRLATTQVVDEETSNLKLQMVDKIAWLERYIQDATQKGSRSDLTRAQSSYEDLIKTIASGQMRNNDEIQEKLESLHSFVENIPDDQENSLKRKEKLLNNIIQSVALVKEDRQVQRNYNIVDENKNQLKLFTKQLEDILKLWDNLKSKLKVEKLSKDELKEIDDVLYKLQTSIAATRNSYRKNKSPMQSRLNYSTPNLTSPALDKKYVSSLSMDGAISEKPSQEQNTEEAEDGAKFKPNNNEKDTFSEIDEIKTQVYYIREKFPESSHKQHLKHKLESYVQMLQEFVKSPHQAISNNASLVLSDIQDILRNMSSVHDTPPEKRTSLEDKFEHIIAVQENVDELAKIVNKFSGTTNDPSYKNTRQQLMENKEYISAIYVPNQYSMINQQRTDILKKIDYLLDIMQKKATNVYRENAVMTATKKKLDTLKEKVNRFTGAYKGVLYNQIEKDLNKLLIEACEKIDNIPQAEDIMKETEKYLKILENRATRDQSFRQAMRSPKSEDEDSFSKLKHELVNIKSTIDNNTPATGVETFLGLKSRLDLVKLGLDQLKCLKDDDFHQRDFLYNEVETLTNFVEAKIALSQKALEQFPIEDNSFQMVIEKLDKIEESFRKLASEIRHFIGTKSDERFYELDEASMKLISRIDEIDLPLGSDLQKRKMGLLREIYQFGELLEKRAKDTETLLQFETDIQDIENNFDQYTKSTEGLGKLADKVKALRTDLENNKLNTILRDRKKKCINRYQEISNKIEKNSVNKEIAKIQNDLDTVALEIEHFDGLQSDKRYYELDDLISQYFTRVDCLNISENSTLHKKKIALLREIQSYSQLLDRKCMENEIRKDLNFKLDSFSKKLEKFAGTMQELAPIEKELRAMESIISSASIDRITKERFSKRYGELLAKIRALKRRSETTENFKGVGTYQSNREEVSPTEVSSEQAIQNKTTAVSYEDASEKDNVEKEITLKQDRLSQTSTVVKSEDVELAKEQYSQVLKNTSSSTKSEESITKNDQVCDSNGDKKSKLPAQPVADASKHDVKMMEAELNKIEALFRKMVPDIRNFVGTTADDKFYELDESSTKLILTMDEMDLPKGSDLHSRKLSLLKDLFKFGDLLDKRAKDTESLVQYESEIADIENNFGQYINSKDALEKLIDKVKVLKLNLQVNSLNTLLRERREICIDKIQEILNKIESLGSQVDSAESIINIEKQFKDIMREIEKFPGVHSDKRYQELDLILVRLFSNLDSMMIPEDSDRFKRKTFMLREIQNYRQILDKRATESEFYKEIRKKIEVVKSKVDNFSGKIEDLKKLEGELKGINNEIDEVDIRDSLRHELKQRLGGVMTKYKIMQKRFKNTKNSPNGSPAKNYKEYIEFKLSELENELDTIQKQVATFRDSEGSEEYSNLEDSLRNLSMAIKKLDVPSDSQYYNRKIDLKRQAVECLTQLDERAEGIEAIVDIEKDLELVKEKIERNLTEQEKNNLDEKLIALQVKLSKLHVNDDLADRKSTCENSTFLYMKKLKEKGLHSSDEENSGTYV